MAKRKLTNIFVVPPISVLDVKQRYWSDRKISWLNLGIQSELGRGDNILRLSSLLATRQKTTSVFDPVLCEIMYRWFSEENDTVYDPFSGGSVRGIVASKLKRFYYGIDIREEQVEHNRIQSTDICDTYMPRWESGSSSDISIDEEYDFFFTCPPYYGLEKYSNDPRDLSNMSHDIFDSEYRKIITKSLTNLKNNRFAAIVVGDIRDRNGDYLQLPRKTVEIFEENGCRLYNDLVLLQEPMTAAMRSFKMMNNNARKIAKCHQNVLVFVKGDAQKASDRLSKFNDGEDHSDITQFFGV